MDILRRYLREILSPQYSVGRKNYDPQNIARWGQPIRTQFWSLGKPIHAKPLKHAACAVVINPYKQFLGVSRKHDPNDFGFPGGHVDPGETPEMAAVRELEEETGLQCSGLSKLVTLKDGNMNVHIFTCKASGEIDTDEAGVIKWVGPEELLNGSFGKQNQIVLRMLGVNT